MSQTVIKPPISYLGGKRKLAIQINEIIERVNPVCVVDLFGGSGSILLNVTNVKSKVFANISEP